MKKEEFLEVFQEQILPDYEQPIKDINKAHSYEMNAYVKAGITSFFTWCVLAITIGKWTYVALPFAIYFIFSFFLKIAGRKSKKEGVPYKETLAESSRIKEELYNKCLSYVVPSLRYSNKDMITEASFREFGIISKSYIDRFWATDQLEGNINGRYYQINQIDIRYLYSDVEELNKQAVTFAGLMIETDLPIDPSFTLTNFRGRINYALPKRSLFPKKPPSLSPIWFSHSLFASFFKSATNNPTLTHSLFNLSILEEITKELQHFPNVHFAISKGKLLLLVPHSTLLDPFSTKKPLVETIWNDFSLLLQDISTLERLLSLLQFSKNT